MRSKVVVLCLHLISCVEKVFFHFSLPVLSLDKLFLKIQYNYFMGEKLNLKDPKKFTEKLQWLKLYDRNPAYTNMADKCEVKKYVAEMIGAEYVIPLFGVWERFDDIDFDKLPNQFILKCTHDSGGFVICEDKTKFDIKKAKQKLEETFTKNYFWQNREFVYRDIKPRIIAEQYIPSLGKKDSVEYKITVINGEVKVITVCGGIPHAAFELRSNDNFSKDWTRQDWYAFYKPQGGTITRPKEMDLMVELSEKLAKDIPQVRVDWYIVDGHVYFGEMTFYTWSGFIKFTPEEWNQEMGAWLKLPIQKRK